MNKDLVERLKTCEEELQEIMRLHQLSKDTKAIPTKSESEDTIFPHDGKSDTCFHRACIPCNTSDVAERENEKPSPNTRKLESENAELMQKYERALEALQKEAEGRTKLEKSIGKLQKALEKNRIVIQDMTESKKIALEMAKQLRFKYESLRNMNRGLSEDLEKAKKDNTELLIKLCEECQSKKMLLERITQLEKAAITPCQKLSEAIEEIRKLQEHVHELEQKKEIDKMKIKLLLKDCKNLDEKVKSVEQKLGKPCEFVSVIVEERDNLLEKLRTMEDARNKYCEATMDKNRLLENMKALEKASEEQKSIISTVKKENCCMKSEITQLNGMLEKCKREKGQVEAECVGLKEKLQKFIEDLCIKEEECCQLRNQLEHLEEKLSSSKLNKIEESSAKQELENCIKNWEEKYSKMETDYKKLQKSLIESAIKCDEKSKLEQELEECKCEINIQKKTIEELKCECMALKLEKEIHSDEINTKTENDFYQLECEWKDKLKASKKENEELKLVINDLEYELKQHNLKFIELCSLCNQQMPFLRQKNPNSCLNNEYIQRENDGNQPIKNINGTQEHVRNMFQRSTQAMESADQQLLHELEALNHQLNNATDTVRIKEKIIDDQLETINQLKDKLRDCGGKLQYISIEMERARKEVSIVREDNRKLCAELRKVEYGNQCLQRQLVALEEELYELNEIAPAEIEKHRATLSRLEMQVEEKQKEWEYHMKVLSQQKDEALKAAHFATSKLLETVDEFQKEVATQKKVQKMLASMLSEKEYQLNAASHAFFSNPHSVQAQQINSAPPNLCPNRTCYPL